LAFRPRPYLAYGRLDPMVLTEVHDGRLVQALSLMCAALRKLVDILSTPENVSGPVEENGNR